MTSKQTTSRLYTYFLSLVFGFMWIAGFPLFSFEFCPQQIYIVQKNTSLQNESNVAEFFQRQTNTAALGFPYQK